MKSHHSICSLSLVPWFQNGTLPCLLLWLLSLHVALLHFSLSRKICWGLGRWDGRLAARFQPRPGLCLQRYLVISVPSLTLSRFPDCCFLFFHSLCLCGFMSFVLIYCHFSWSLWGSTDKLNEHVHSPVLNQSPNCFRLTCSVCLKLICFKVASTVTQSMHFCHMDLPTAQPKFCHLSYKSYTTSPFYCRIVMWENTWQPLWTGSVLEAWMLCLQLLVVGPLPALLQWRQLMPHLATHSISAQVHLLESLFL